MSDETEFGFLDGSLAQDLNSAGGEEKVSILGHWLQKSGQALLNFAVRAALAVIIYLLVRKVLTKVLALLETRLKKSGVDESVRSFVLSILRYGILGFTILTIVVQLDIVEGSTIAAFIASAGVGISLAMQGVLSNFAGGVLLLVLKPFRAGDYIVVPAENIEGTVLKIEMYYTTIEKIDRQVISIPNASLTNQSVINMNVESDRRIDMKIGVSYSADLDQVKKALGEILDSDPRIARGDRQIFVDSLGSSSVVVGFRAHVPSKDYFAVKWDLNEKIKKRFDEEGIEIPYDQLDVHVR